MEKRVTIKDVAADADVSISVVSYILNDSKKVSISDKTKKKVLASAEKLGYVQNKNAAILRSGKSYTIGIVSFWENSLAYSLFIDGISRTLDQAGYKNIIFSATEKSDIYDYISYYRDHMIDGIIFLTPYDSFINNDLKRYIKVMNDLGIKFSMINESGKNLNAYLVPIDYFRSTYVATRYFIEKGYKEISYVRVEERLDHASEKQRMSGYLQAVGEKNLKPLIYTRGEIADNIGSFRAVVTDKSNTAYYVFAAAHERGYKIPEDFEVIAGNTEYYSRYMYPAVSSVAIPAREIGALAAKAVVMQINGFTPPDPPPFEYNIVLRDSTRRDTD